MHNSSIHAKGNITTVYSSKVRILALNFDYKYFSDSEKSESHSKILALDEAKNLISVTLKPKIVKPGESPWQTKLKSLKDILLIENLKNDLMENNFKTTILNGKYILGSDYLFRHAHGTTTSLLNLETEHLH